MRSIRVDITGTTDASGNFSQTIRLDKTDEWRVLKIAIGTTGPAEWALTTSGTPLTYGRGRRVTLGPELLQPFDTLTVSCTGGPTNAALSGSCTGMAGSEREIIASYVPAPNTIALDSLATQRLIDSFTQAPNVVTTNRLYVPPTGTQNVRVQLNQNAQAVTFTNFTVVGNATGIVYIFPTAGGGGTGGFDEWFKPAPPDIASGFLFSLNTTGSANGVETIITADLAESFVIASLIGAGTSSGNALLAQIVGPILPFDWSTANQFNNNTASLTGTTPPAGKKAVLAAFSCKVASNAAVSVFVQLIIKDGTGALLWSGLVSTPATIAASDYHAQSGLAVPATAAASPITITIGAIGANTFADLAIGGYFA